MCFIITLGAVNLAISLHNHSCSPHWSVNFLIVLSFGVVRVIYLFNMQIFNHQCDFQMHPVYVCLLFSLSCTFLSDQIGLFICLLICLRNSYLVSLTWKKERKDDCFHLLIDSSDACKSKGRPAKTRNLEPSPVLHVDVIVCFPDSGLEVEPGLSPLGTPMWYSKMSQPLRRWLTPGSFRLAVVCGWGMKCGCIHGALQFIPDHLFKYLFLVQLP